MRGEFGPEYYRAHYSRRPNGWGARLEGDRPWQAIRISSVLKKARARRVLEVGCGLGFFLARWDPRFDVVGVDVSSHAIRNAAHLAPNRLVAIADARTLPFRAAAFDAVLAFDVLEHIPAPGRAVDDFARVLRPRGLLVFSVPNMDSIGRVLKGEQWHGKRDPTHCSLLTQTEWSTFLAEGGFRPLKVWYDGLWDTPYFHRIPRTVQDALFKVPAIMASMIWTSPRSLGENVFMLAVKE